MKKVQWTASLSNGETHYENKGNFTEIAGALSPWQRLLAYCTEHSLKITSLSLYTEDGRRWTLPSAGKNPKFRAFDQAPQPVSYRFFRKFGLDPLGPNAGKEDNFSCIEAAYENGTQLQTWVNEDNNNASWTLAAYK